MKQLKEKELKVKYWCGRDVSQMNRDELENLLRDVTWNYHHLTIQINRLRSFIKSIETLTISNEED